MNEDIQKLELRITELENQLKSASTAKVDPEELKTFHKVSQQLGISGCINECQPSICVICYACYHCYNCLVCYRCITECTPCILNSGFGAGGGRVGYLG